VAAFVAKIFEKAGYSVGLYTSPHLSDFSERIRINGRPISRDEVVGLTEFLRTTLAARAHPSIDDGSWNPSTSITFFEFTTLLAFLYFLEKKVDLAVVEVGMGGRLDATNVLSPLVAAITTIGLEHQQYLGKTLEAISREKAGIVKAHGTLVTAVAQPRALAPIRSRCSTLGTRIYRVGKDIRVKRNCQGGFAYQGISRTYRDLRLNLLGDHQITNAALAVAITELLTEKGYAVGEASLREGLGATRWPGRMELVSRTPRVLLDGAHNVAAVTRLCRELRACVRYRRLILVMGIMEDKALIPMLRTLVPLAYRTIFTRPKPDRAASPHALLKQAPTGEGTMQVVEDVRQAVRTAMLLAGPDDLVCVTGSLYTVAEARELFFSTVEL
jgi:dihydrofolate synthase/folylpolyglutamate synthase